MAFSSELSYLLICRLLQPYDYQYTAHRIGMCSTLNLINFHFFIRVTDYFRKSNNLVLSKKWFTRKKYRTQIPAPDSDIATIRNSFPAKPSCENIELIHITNQAVIFNTMIFFRKRIGHNQD